MFKSSHLASSIAQSFARCNPCQNSHNGKDKLASGTSIEGSNRCPPAPAAACAPIPAVIPVAVPLVAFGCADSSMVGYLENDLQRIVRSIFEARSRFLLVFAPIPAPVVATAPHYKSLCEQPLKARFLNIYWGKTHLECYNFF